jgi:hypothetical protein
MEMSDQLYVPVALLSGKEPQYTIERRLDEPQNRHGRCGVQRKSLAPARNRTPAVYEPVSHSVTISHASTGKDRSGNNLQEWFVMMIR